MPRPIPSVNESKRAASLLLKDLRSADTVSARAAAARFMRIAPFKGITVDEVIARRDGVRRKHALDVVAREQGYLAWKNLKDAADVAWLPRGAEAFSHNWCKTYEEARAHLDARGGYLLTGHGKCFIAERVYIEFLGLDPDDPRWDAIGHDVKRPADPKACEELARQLSTATANP